MKSKYIGFDKGKLVVKDKADKILVVYIIIDGIEHKFLNTDLHYEYVKGEHCFFPDENMSDKDKLKYRLSKYTIGNIKLYQEHTLSLVGAVIRRPEDNMWITAIKDLIESLGVLYIPEEHFDEVYALLKKVNGKNANLSLNIISKMINRLIELEVITGELSVHIDIK